MSAHSSRLFAPQRPGHTPPSGVVNEMTTLAGLRLRNAQISIQTTSDDEIFTGNIVWSDVNCIAIRFGDKTRVFNKASIAFWDYREANQH